MRKIKCYFIYLFFILGCTNQQSRINNKTNCTKFTTKNNNIVFNEKISNIIFYSEDIEVETAFNIQCENFLNSFSDIDSICVNDPLKINNFINELKKINPSNDDNYLTVDTRYMAKIQYMNGQTEVLCGDKFDVIFRNKKFRASSNFISNIYSYTGRSSIMKD